MTFDQYIGMTKDTEPDQAIIKILPHHMNPIGNINGGVLISLADNIATGTANRLWQQKTGRSAFLVGVDLHATLLSNQRGGTITARSEPVRVGNRLVVMKTRVTGDQDKLLAEVTTTHIPVE